MPEPGGVPSAHADPFARAHLPPRELWPDFDYDSLPELRAYPDRMNCAAILLDDMAAGGHKERPVLHFEAVSWSYGQLLDLANRIANVLVEDLGLVPGNRVLLRAANTPMLVACWFAVLKAGGVCVTTMQLLRARELTYIIDKANVSHALCDVSLAEAMEDAKDRTAGICKHVSYFTSLGDGGADATLDVAASAKPASFRNCETAADDVALIAFTSGTTGNPKATMHFHRDLLIIADAYAREVLEVTPDDIFVGSPPLAFTFGLGGLAIFPLRFGATATLLENASPPNLIEIIETYKATISFTAPTAYRAMMRAMDDGADLSSLRLAVSAGETLPAPVFEEWVSKTGTPILDGIGSTEMLHIFLSNRAGEATPGATGRPVTGYEAKIVDDDMNEVADGEIGKLAVRGPTGCRYLADARQANYIRDGWNLTGDTFMRDAAGIFHFVARSDDVIVSAGYNIAGPEVEAALLTHRDVAECAVIGVPDESRGNIVEAHVVLRENVPASEECATSLQDHVKATIAPYKYPRSIKFIDALPKTATGKVQRFRLKSS